VRAIGDPERLAGRLDEIKIENLNQAHLHGRDSHR